MPFFIAPSAIQGLEGPNGFRRNIVNKRCKMSPYDHAVHGKESPRMRIPTVRTNFSHFGR